MIREFLERIFGDQTGNAVVGLRDRSGPEGRVNRFQWFSYPAELDKMVDYAEAHAGEDLYYSPILYGDKTTKLKSGREVISRTPENALTTQVIYSDADTAHPADFRLQPSIAVQTSNGRFHCYWSLIDPISADKASEIAHRITTAHAPEGSDPNGWSANKVLRIPGSLNTSHGPFPERVSVVYTGEVYDDLTISGAYDDVIVNAPVAIMGRLTAPTEVAQPENLPDYAEALDLLPERILDMALAEPQSGPDGYRSQLRWKLMARMFDEVPELTFDQVLTIAWHAPASRKWSQEDARGITGLIDEATKIHAEVMERKGAFDYAPESYGEQTGDDFSEMQTEKRSKVKLLTSAERKKTETMRSWIDTYVEYAGSRVAKQNVPYDTINAWSILSANFCDKAYIPRKNGPEAPNLYTMTLGETTTGKSQALKLWRTVMNECFSEDSGWDIGGNASENALAKHLIERDHMMSVFNKDEAHGLFKVWNTQDWSNGMMTILALLYDGYMPPMLRMGNSDISGKSAHAYLVMHLMGTPDAMVREMTREMYAEGFLARFITAIGEPRQITEDSMAEEDAQGEYVKAGFDPIARQFASEFASTKIKMLQKHGAGRYPVTITREAARRVGKAKWDLVNLSTPDDQNFDILNPSLVRMGVNIRKAATLLALSEGRDEVNLNDTLLAIKAAEEWTDNLFDITSRISASEFQRACDEVEAFVLSRPEPPSKASVIRRFRAVETIYLTRYLQSLYDQNRLYEFKGTNGAWYIAKPGTGGNK